MEMLISIQAFERRTERGRFALVRSPGSWGCKTFLLSWDYFQNTTNKKKRFSNTHLSSKAVKIKTDISYESYISRNLRDAGAGLCWLWSRGPGSCVWQRGGRPHVPLAMIARGASWTCTRREWGYGKAYAPGIPPRSCLGEEHMPLPPPIPLFFF